MWPCRYWAENSNLRSATSLFPPRLLNRSAPWLCCKVGPVVGDEGHEEGEEARYSEKFTQLELGL